MAEQLTLARPYAKAAFEYGLAANQLDQWQTMLSTLAAVVQNAKVKQWLSEPSQSVKAIVDGLVTVVGDAMATNGRNFLMQLAENKRLELLPEIYQLFEQWLLQQQNREDVVVQSAFELTSEQVNKIAEAMKKRLGKEVSVQTQIDSTLIGGVRIQAGDLVIDDSIKGRLDRLAESLQV